MRISQQEIAASNQSKHSDNLIKKSESILFKPIKLSSTKRLTYLATFTAISLVLKMLGNLGNFGMFKITLVYLPWILSSIVLGPLYGSGVGFITDVLGQLIVPTGGSVMPLITLGNTLFPLIIGFCFKYIPLHPFARLTIGTVTAVLVCTLGFNSWGLYLLLQDLLSMNYLQYLLTRRLLQVPMVILNMVLAFGLLPLFKKAKIFS